MVLQHYQTSIVRPQQQQQQPAAPHLQQQQKKPSIESSSSSNGPRPVGTRIELSCVVASGGGSASSSNASASSKRRRFFWRSGSLAGTNKSLSVRTVTTVVEREVGSDGAATLPGNSEVEKPLMPRKVRK